MRNSASRMKTQYLEDSRDADVLADRFPVASAKETMARVGSLLAGRRLKLFFTAVILAAGAWCGVEIPKRMGAIVDVVAQVSGEESDRAGNLGATAESAAHVVTSSADAQSQVLWLLASMIGFAIGAGLLGAIGFRMAGQIAESMIADLREEMVATALGLPVERVERAGAGDVVSRATDDVAQVSQAVTQTLPVASGAVFTVLVSIGGVGSVDWRFLAAFLVVLPVHVLGIRKYLKYAPDIYAAERGAMAERSRIVLSTIHGLPSLRAFDLGDQRQEQVSRWSWRTVRHAIDARIATNVLMGRMHFAEFLGLASTLVLGFYLVQAGHTTIGGATAAMLLFMRLFGPLTRMVFVLDVAQSGATSLTRIVGLLDQQSLIPPRTEISPQGGAIELEDVSFSYREKNNGAGDDEVPAAAVEDVSLSVPEGQTLAIVGTSGAGKSTIAAIISGLRIATSGSVQVAGVDMTAHADDARGSVIMLVTQEVHVFEGTLRDDLILATGEDAVPTDAEIQQALQQVGADWVDRLPQGLDTLVGHGGFRLDPVAAQQVALARILLADPRAVVLDEATAEAGSAGAEVLADAARAVTSSRTAVVVAHRLDQAAAADQVAVMEHGKVMECGTHDELVAAGGAYAGLWQAWQSGRE